MTPSDLLACAPRIAPSGLARVRLRKDNALGTLVPPGRDGKHLVIALDGKRGPPVRRLAKDVELVEREAPPPPKLEAACVNCGAVARLKCTKCGAVGWEVGRGQTPCAVDGVLTDVALKPVTGRRHQLRRHCGETLGAPILGDDLYGGPRKGIGLFLYCRRLALAHPLEPGRLVSCEIDEPRRFARHRAKARKGWAWARDHGEL